MDTVWRFLNKLRIVLPLDSALLLLGMYSREWTDLQEFATSRWNLCYEIVHNSTIHNSQEAEAMHVPAEWINGLTKWGKYTNRISSALRTSWHAMTWTSLEGIMLSELSQSQKTNTVSFHLYEGPKKLSFRETGSIDRKDGCQKLGVRGGNKDLLVSGCSFSFTQHRKSLGSRCTTV